MKLYYNYPYDGEITEERTGTFVPIANIEQYLDELNSFFDEDKPLVTILAAATENDPTIKLFFTSYHLLFSAPLLSESTDELGQALPSANLDEILKENKVSELLYSWLIQVNPEEIYLSDYVVKLAQPGQTIPIERYDSEYGNYNYEVNS
jgi:hypothetical protein